MTTQPNRVRAALKISGIPELDATLKALPDKLFNQAMVTAAKAGSNLVVKAARAKVPKETRLLSESLGVVVRKYKRSGKVIAVIGPRHGFKGKQTKRSRKNSAMAALRAVRNPAFYGHLVEFSHRIVRGGRIARIRHSKKKGQYVQPGQGRVVGKSDAHPFLGPAYQSQKGPAREAMREKLKQWIESQRAKGRITA